MWRTLKGEDWLLNDTSFDCRVASEPWQLNKNVPVIISEAALTSQRHHRLKDLSVCDIHVSS